MKNNIFRWVLAFLVIAILCLIGVIVYPPIVFSNEIHIIVAAISVFFIVYALVLIACYELMNKFKMLISWKLAAYLVIIVGASISINFLLVAIHSRSMLLFFLITFIILALANYVLSKLFFAIMAREAALISMIMSLIGSFLCIFTSSVPN
jgi:hypothetical protein